MLHLSPVKSIHFKKRFDLAGRDEEYLSAYQHLCGYAYNDLKALERRHLVIKKDGNIEIGAFESLEPEPRSEVHLIDLANSILLRSSACVHDFYKSGYFADINNLRQALDASREHWPHDSR